MPNFERNKEEQGGGQHVKAGTFQKVDRPGSGALFVGGLAAILASTCCLGPLVLALLGVSGAWIGNLTKFEPYRLYFIAGALIALFFAGRRIFRPAKACAPGQVCAVPQTRRVYKILFGIVSALVFIALVYPYVVSFFY
jgi:mercuric ion transport protein